MNDIRERNENPTRDSREPALSAHGLRPTKGNENPGCPISRAFFAREVGIFNRAKPKGGCCVSRGTDQ